MPTTSTETKTGADTTNNATNGTGNGFEEPNPFVQPGVPEKRQHTATVYYLDATKNDFHIHKSSDGQDLFDMVASQLRIVEKDYFALSFTNEKSAEREWLYNDQRISKQVGGRQWEFTFEFKFYPPEPSSLVDDLARRHLMLQCRRDICSGRIPTSFATQALLASYLAQAELGDFAPSEQYADYLRSANVAPSVDDKLISKIQELHHQHRGQTSSEAEINYLNTCKKLNMYGIYAFEGKDKNTPVTVGIGAHGVNIYKDNVRIHRFPWQNIDKISYKNSNFIIKLKPETVGKGEDRYWSTRMSDYHIAKKAWKTAVEHHTFFRLIQPETKPQKSLFRWGSQRFRYQGRTQFQTKMASQMFDHNAARPNDSARVTSRSVDDIAQRALPVSTSPVRYVDDRTETRSPLSSPDQSYVVSSATEERKGKKGIDEEVGVRRLDYASSVPVSSSSAAENLHASSSSAASRRPQAPSTTTTTASYCHLAPQHDLLQPFLRDQELQGTPMSNMVSVYNKGFYEGHTGDDEKSPKSWMFWRRHKTDSASPSRSHHPQLHHVNGTSTHRLQETARNDEMPSFPLRYFSSVYHSGSSLPQRHAANRRFDEFERETHAGVADVVEQTDLNRDNYLFAQTKREGDARLERCGEVDSCPLRSTTLAYHSGRPPHRRRAPKRPKPTGITTGYIEDDTTSECSTCAAADDDEDSRTPKKMAVLHLKRPAKKRFGFWKSRDSEIQHDTEPSTSKGFPIARDPFVGVVHDTEKENEFVPNPLRDDVDVYHSGRSRAPIGNRKKSSKFDREKHFGEEDEVDKENIDRDAYASHADMYRGHLDETSRRRDMETMPIKEFAKVYHPGESRLQRKTKNKRGVSAESETSGEESVEDEEFTSRGRPGTNFFKFLRSSPKSGYPEKSVYAGKLDETEKRKELVEDPLRYRVAVYHSGYSTRPHWCGKSRVVHEGEEDVVEKGKLDAQRYPAGGEKYAGHLERMEKSEDLDRRPLREFSSAYHPGFSSEAPSKRFLKNRLFGSRSDSETDEETKKKRRILTKTPPKEKESGSLFGILRGSGRKEPPKTPKSTKISAYPPMSPKYTGPLNDVIKTRDMDSEPLRENVAVYHSGYSLAPFGKSKFWNFERWTHPGEEEIVEKERVRLDTYNRSPEPYTGPLQSTNKNVDLHTVPLRLHTRVYHPGYYEIKMQKAERAKSDKESGFESDPSTDSEEKRRLKAQSPLKDEKSKRSGSFGFGIRLPHWKFGGKGAEKDSGYSMSKEPFKGALDATDRSSEMDNEPLRSTVDVYHCGWSTVPGWRSKKPTDRVFHPGDVEVVEKALVQPESYGIRTAAFEGELKTTPRETELDTVPVREKVDVYHTGHSVTLKLRRRRASESAESDSDEERDRFEEKTTSERKREEEEGRGKRAGSFSIKFPNWKLPSWDRSPGKESPKQRQDKEPVGGPLGSTAKSGELEETPKRRPAEKKTIGASKTYKVTEKEKKSEKATPEKFRRISESERDAEMKTTPTKTRSSENEEDGRRASFRFGIKMPSWKFGAKEDAGGRAERSSPDRNLHGGESTQKSPKKYDVFVRTAHPGDVEIVEREKVDPESYQRSAEPYEGHLDTTPKTSDLDGVPIEMHAKVYHSGQSQAQMKKSKRTRKTSASSPPVEDESVPSPRSERGHSFGFGFKMPHWKRGNKKERSEYPTSGAYSGPLEDTKKASELEPENLRSNVHVYHPGSSTRPEREWHLFGRAKHPGEEEVVEKEKVTPESYFRSSAPFEGELHSTEKREDIATVPIHDHARLYHPGHSYAMKIAKKRRESESEESDSDGEGRGFGFALPAWKLPTWKRDRKEKRGPYADFPSSPEYSGPVDGTERSAELRSAPIREQAAVYHSGYSVRPDNRFFERWLHPGEVEVVEKEKIDLHAYKKGEPYKGPLGETNRATDLDTVPIRGYAKVYHPGQSDVKVKKTKNKKLIPAEETSSSESQGEEAKTGRSNSRSGRSYSFGLNFKMPKWKRGAKREKESPISDYPGVEKYAGDLDDTSPHIELLPSPLRQQVNVYHSGHSIGPMANRDPQGHRITAVPLKSEDDKENLDSTQQQKDVKSTPLSDHSYTLKIDKTKKVKREEDSTDEESKLGRQGKGFGLNFKLPKWKFGRKGEREEPIPEYPAFKKYSGPLEDTTKSAELEPENLRSNVHVYHPGSSTRPEREWHLFGRAKHPGEEEVVEKEKVTPESYFRSSAPFEGELHSTEKREDIDTVPIHDHARLYHPGHSYALKVTKKRRESESEESDSDGEGRGFGFALPAWKLPTWKRNRKEKRGPYADFPTSPKYAGPLNHTHKQKELQTKPVKDHAKIYHSGHSTGPLAGRDPKGHKIQFTPAKKEEDQKKRSVELVGKDKEKESAALPEHSYALKIEKTKKTRNDATSDNEDDMNKAKVFGLNFKLPKWKFGRKEGREKTLPDYPVSKEYSGPLEDTKKASELEPENLRSNVHVYHPGSSTRPEREWHLFGRAKHPGEEEVVEKEKVTPESYFRSSAPFEGELHSTEKREDIATVPIHDHARLYHPGHSYALKIGKRRRTTSESEESEGGDRSFNFGLPAWKLPTWKRDHKEKRDDYPVTGEYSGPLDETNRRDELPAEALREKVKVYHTGYSMKPGHWDLFGRFRHPGEDEFVEKEKIETDAYPSTEPFSGDLHSTGKNRDLDAAPLHDYAKVYHTGQSHALKRNKPKGTTSGRSDDESDSGDDESGFYFGLPSWKLPTWKKGGDHGGVSSPKAKTAKNKEKIDLHAYKKGEPYEGPLGETNRATDLDTVPIRGYAKVYHPGQSDVKVKKTKKKDEAAAALPESDDESKVGRSPSKSGRAFGFNFKLPSWKRGEGAERSSPDRNLHGGESTQKSPKKYDVFVRTAHPGDVEIVEREKVDPESYQRSAEPYEGHLSSTEKAMELDTVPIEQQTRKYHPGQSTEPKKKRAETASSDEEPSKHRPSRSHSFGLNFKLPKWKFGRKGEREEPIPEYPAFKKYSGPLEDTTKSAELEPENLRSNVHVYHPGSSTRPEREWHLFGRAKHPGEEEVVEKEKVTPESYFRSSAPFEGELHSTEKREDIDTVPIHDHARLYHPGHSYAMKVTKKRRESESEESDSDGEGRGFGFALPAWKLPTWKRDRKEKRGPYADFPSSPEYSGPVDGTERSAELRSAPIREQAAVYHSGYSVRPDNRFFERWLHPGEVEVVEKEKIDLHAYKKGEPYEGPLGETNRATDLDTVPIRGYAKVYHPGQSDVKVKKTKKKDEAAAAPSESDDESKVGRSPSKSGRAFGFNFKLPSWGRQRGEKYPSTEKYSGPLEDIPKYQELQPVPLRENVDVYHSGRAQKTYDPFVRTAHPGEEESVEKENVKPESYRRRADPYEGPLEETHKNAEVEARPLKEHSRAYHSGYSTKEPRKWRLSMRSTSSAVSEEDLNRTLDSVDSVGSSGSSRFGKLIFWRTPGKREGPEPFHLSGFPTKLPPFTGALESTTKAEEADGGRLRDTVTVYHSGYSEQPHSNRKYRLFGRLRHEGEEDVVPKDDVAPEFYSRKAKRYTGPLEKTTKNEELETGPIRRYANVYHPGRSHVKSGKKERKTRASESSSDASSDEETKKRVGFHEEPQVVEVEKSPKKEERKEETPLTAKSLVIHVKSPKKAVDEEKKREAETPKTQTKSPRRSGGIFGFWRSSGKSEAPKAAPTTSRAAYPTSEKYAGVLDSTGKWMDFDGTPLRSAVDVYHSGHSKTHRSARFAHPGVVEVVAKANVDPKSYQHTSTRFDGALHSTARTADLDAEPLKQHTNVYHDGHSYVKSRRVHKRTASEASYTSAEDEPQAKRTHGATIPKTEERTSTETPKSAKSKRFRRKTHPGSVEFVKKEKVKPESYKRSPNPYMGPLDMTQRDVFFETKPIKEYADVYHPGRSDIKQKTTKTPQKRKYVAVLKSPKRTAENGANEARSAPSSHRVRLFSRDAPEQKEEVVDKSRVNLSKYPVVGGRSTPRIVVPLNHADDLQEAPIREHANVYHPGQSVQKTTKKGGEGYRSASEDSTSGIGSGDEGSPKKMRRGEKRESGGWTFRDLFNFTRKVDYTYPMVTAPYRGPVESLDRQAEISIAPLKITCQDSEALHGQMAASIPRTPSPFSMKITEVTLNVFVQNERVSDYNCEVVVGPWPEAERDGLGAGLVRGVIGFEEERRAAEVDFVADGRNIPDPTPATMESAPQGRSLFASIRRQLSQVTKKKEKKEKTKKEKKEKKGKKKAKLPASQVEIDSASATSSDSTDVEVTNREVVVPSDNKENVTVTASVPTNDGHEDKTIPSGPYVPASENDGIVVREEKHEEVYRIVGTGNTPVMDPSNTSLAGTVAQYIKENKKAPGVQLVEKNVTVRELSGQLPTNVGEGSLPHTTIQSWHETAVGPESVSTDVDEHGNVIKRTVKTQQVKHTVQRQTYQTYTVNEEEPGTGKIETSRQMITPIGDNGGTVSLAKSPVVETHTRTVAYENPSGEAPLDIPGEFISSKTVTQGNRTVETITYKTEKDGVIETHVEHRVTIHSGSEIDHDAELSQAILEATNMNPDMTVERIEVKQESQC